LLNEDEFIKGRIDFERSFRRPCMIGYGSILIEQRSAFGAEREISAAGEGVDIDASKWLSR
jgi:hypothetical protein